ncbi:MAG: hypothetical protein P9M07_00285 [Candidatus Aceula meridiana]|nr:hypothetical protein [Candidatus Aceula meridiana]
MSKKILIVFLICTIFSPSAFAQYGRSPKVLETRAFTYVQRADQLLSYAHKIMELRPDKESAEIFVELYLQASRLYGDAARLLRAIGPFYIQQSVIDKFAKAELDCLKTVDEARRMVNKGEIVKVSDWEIKKLLNEIREIQDELSE